MARRRVVAAVAVAIGLLLARFGGSADAQTLQRLTVTQLTLTADTAAPLLDKPFHLIVTAHVKERVKRLDNVVLPILVAVELLGDENAVTTDAGGTTYKETITVVAHHPGTVTIAPVTLDATNARTGKNERYSSNPLVLNVGGPPLVQADGVGAVLRNAVTIALVALAAVVAVVLLRRRPRRPLTLPPPPQPVAPPPPPVRDPRDDLRDALATLRVQRTRATAVAVRSLVRRMVGAGDAETLEDVLHRPSASDPLMRDLLRALERASFTHDGDLATAIDGAVAALERVAA
jgi:hypothetical protein